MKCELPELPLPEPIIKHLAPTLRKAHAAHHTRCEKVAKDATAVRLAESAVKSHEEGGRIPAWAMQKRLPDVQSSTAQLPLGPQGLASLGLPAEVTATLGIDANTTNEAVAMKLSELFAGSAVKENLRRMQLQHTASKERANHAAMLDDIRPSFEEIRTKFQSLFDGDSLEWDASWDLVTRWCQKTDLVLKSQVAIASATSDASDRQFAAARERAVAAFESMPLLAAHEAATVATLMRVLPKAGISLNPQQRAAIAKAVHPTATPALLTYDIRGMIDRREQNLQEGGDQEMRDPLETYADFENETALRESLSRGRGRGRGKGRGRGRGTTPGKGRGRGRGASRGGSSAGPTGLGKGKSKSGPKGGHPDPQPGGKGKGSQKGKGPAWTTRPAPSTAKGKARGKSGGKPMAKNGKGPQGGWTQPWGPGW